MKLRSVFCFLPAAVLTGFMLFVVLGCATGGTARYVGHIGSTKPKERVDNE